MAERKAHNKGPLTNGAADAATFEFPNDRAKIDKAESELIDALTRHQFPEAARFAVRLALEEALVNAFKHGHKSLPPQTPVKFSYRVAGDQVQMDVVDQGAGFNPAEVPDPTLEENLDKPSGRGLLLMRAYMTSLEHLGRGNHLRLVFRKAAAG